MVKNQKIQQKQNLLDEMIQKYNQRKIGQLLSFAQQVEYAYDRKNEKKGEKIWGTGDHIQGIRKDLDDLQMALNNGDVNEIAHEITDALCSILVISCLQKVDIIDEFRKIAEEKLKMIV